MPSIWFPYEQETPKSVGTAAKHKKTSDVKKKDVNPFINYSHPSEAKAYRIAIRSHVTGVQHQQKRAALAAKRNGDQIRPQHALLGKDKNSLVRKDDDEDIADSEASQTPSGSSTGSINTNASSLSLHSSRSSSQDSLEKAGGMVVPGRLAVAQHDPFDPYIAAADWSDNISGLLDHYLGNACDFLRSTGLSREAAVLRSNLVIPDMYIDSFLFNALITLTTTKIGVTETSMGSIQLIAWLRSNFLIMIRTAISKGGEDPRTLAVGLALLIGWETEFGDTENCLVHSRALPALLSAEHEKSGSNLFSYPDRNDQSLFRGGARLTPGFEFYITQNLLPPRLLFLVGSLNYFQPNAPGARRWMRELWASIGGCLPEEDVARSNFKQRELRSRISQLVRQAGYMLGSLMRYTANEPAAAQPLTEGINGLWTATLKNDWNSLIGTVYDEILLWCICVYCTTAEKRADEHMDAIDRILARLDLRNLPQFLSLMARYSCPSCIGYRLRQLWDDLDQRRVSREQVQTLKLHPGP
ncbi:hypothetical protein HII31_03767 [Pseudocercospora fuligena]|uniref:Transcription factor domain-containing protein n=1 Tax=Pseudocercospora fuligena TaxID=685502 RepID=A0A8H6VQ93_9PEZI|nr:hypothetical protein HII31_03767 [Pseudocercospora fuligena]